VRKKLGPAWREEDYSPPYNPWEQRLCLVPDGDMFAAIREGRASVATGLIDKVVADGIMLEDGRKLDADVIVTATGLRLSTLGKIGVSLDGQPVDVAQHFWYRDCMLSNVPNLAVMFGYLNAGWTLRVDIVTDWLCRLLRQMDHWRMDVATPLLPDDHGLEVYQPFDLFSSGYLQRGKHLIPKSATTAPWRIHMHYREDRKELEAAPIDDGWMNFARLGNMAEAAE
jgi:monooxygenase